MGEEMPKTDIEPFRRTCKCASALVLSDRCLQQKINTVTDHTIHLGEVVYDIPVLIEQN
jgi:hypothetical protein